MTDKYKNYFRDHFRATFCKYDLDRDEKWFYSQWKIINKKHKISPSDEILEIGSGLGGIYKFLTFRNRYAGIEMDPDVVQFSNSYYKTDKFIHSSIEKYNPKINYNIIFAIEVLEHLQNPLTNIKKIRSLLKNDGVFIGTTPYPFLGNILIDKTHTFVLHPKNWERNFYDCGFTDVKIYPMSFFPFIWRLNKNLNFRLPFYVPLTGFISRCLIIAKK